MLQTQTDIYDLLARIKRGEKEETLEVFNPEQELISTMVPLTESDQDNAQIISDLAAWRDEFNYWFPAQFKVTESGTKVWFEKGLMAQPDRLLFLLQTPDGQNWGHIGLYRFDFENMTCEIDNVVRGNKLAGRGAMTAVLKKLIAWTFDNFDFSELWLTVYQDNERAITLYERCGFETKEVMALRKEVTPDRTSWIHDDQATDRYEVKMCLKRYNMSF